MSHSDDDNTRLVYVATHHGQAARAIRDEFRAHQDRFDFHTARLTNPVWTHISRKNTSTHFRVAKRGRVWVCIEAREVIRLWWPEGASVDPRTERERRSARRSGRNLILEEYEQRANSRRLRRSGYWLPEPVKRSRKAAA